MGSRGSRHARVESPPIPFIINEVPTHSALRNESVLQRGFAARPFTSRCDPTTAIPEDVRHDTSIAGRGGRREAEEAEEAESTTY